MKKILIIHNNYRIIGGEDTSVDNEIKYLQNEYTVDFLLFDNLVTNYFLQFFYFFINKNLKSMKLLENKIKLFSPDVVYIHNTWFKASLGIFNVLENFEGEVILKIHNFRYDCTRYFLTKYHLKNNTVCPKCGLTKKDLKIFNRYFTDSIFKSLIVKIYGKKYFKILKNSKFKLFLLTNFHKRYLKTLGIPSSRLYVVPNQIKFEETLSIKHNGDYFLYAGRISKEKGVEDLIQAYLMIKNKEKKLKIIGDGPDYLRLRNKYSSSEIEFIGELENKEVLEYIKNSSGVVTATKLYEGQPTLLCEASANGIVSIFPRTGGIHEFFPKDYQFSFEKNNINDLSLKIEMLASFKDIIKLGQQNKMFLKDYLSKNEFSNYF